MPSTPLNSDVLLYILSVSPPKTATSIMATCSFLYHEGAKVILRDPVELFDSEEKVLALLRFVQAEDFLRCSYVRQLHIIYMPESVAQIMSDIIPRMTNLKQLSIVLAEQIFTSHPYLLPKFAALRSLTTLVIGFVGERCAEMIRTLQSELRFANIHLPVAGMGHLPPETASHPVLMLKGSASTLQELTCHNVAGTNAELVHLPPEVVYPELRTLNLHQSKTLPPSPIPFIHAFPNLTTLNVEYPPGTQLAGDLESYRSEREARLAAQRPSQSSGPGWRHIQTFTGHPVALWMLGLKCRIPHLLLDYALAVTATQNHDAPFILADVLAYARPTRLTLMFEQHSLSAVLAGAFVAALQSEGASGLRSLAFTIGLMPADRNLDVGRVLIDIEAALSGLRLHDLLFSVRDIGLYDYIGASVPSAPSIAPHADSTNNRAALTLKLGERTLNDFDVLALVQRLPDAIPTLQNMLILVERPIQCGGNIRAGWSAKTRWKNAQPMYTGGEVKYTEAGGSRVMREVFASTIKGWNMDITGRG
ncbi:hypothetical protein GSI_07714 [Ganoderma sinense ZZ0214-1]|uniref:F-box domain-containing protein n=1 Tax=Ganoderma sinense ZZ0214-1 TaxID=1077348 RepID=A0A2G8S8N0_9APHY|nr:hypothetical protein GSI_07714 [Ganoderma sinense ZZ0214-1]